MGKQSVGVVAYKSRVDDDQVVESQSRSTYLLHTCWSFAR